MKFRKNHKKYGFLFSVLILAVFVCVHFLSEIKEEDAFRAETQEQRSTVNPAPGPDFAAEELQEDYENDRIEAALLDRSHRIENCTVTWYTSGTCGKQPGDATYGITASGLPVTEHLTCATDPAVIPMYSDVFVQYADGTIEQLWATDTGVKGNHIDIYIEDYDAAIRNGRQTLNVWFLPPEGSNHEPA